jgi:hypothetical protein
VPYLAPPPDRAPVVVVRDIGGSFAAYKRQTGVYRTQRREVRLHECRSACTIALSLPRVCVFKSSVLRFAKVYDPWTKRVDVSASDSLFRSYPHTVRARLGYLTRKFKTLSGEDLIALGVRDCEAAPAAARAETAATGLMPETSYVPPGQGPVARFLRKVGARVRANVDTGAPARIASKLTGKVIALLPDRSTFAAILPDRTTVPAPQITQGTSAAAAGRGLSRSAAFSAPASSAASSDAPLPPPRPGLARSLLLQGPVLDRSRLAKLPPVISGGYPALPAHLRAYAPLR